MCLHFFEKFDATSNPTIVSAPDSAFIIGWRGVWYNEFTFNLSSGLLGGCAVARLASIQMHYTKRGHPNQHHNTLRLTFSTAPGHFAADRVELAAETQTSLRFFDPKPSHATSTTKGGDSSGGGCGTTPLNPTYCGFALCLQTTPTTPSCNC